jgi:hypothetical protein
MRSARTIVVGLGIIILLGVGAASLSRAQQTGATSKPRSQAQTEMRERLLKLRSEIDVLQAEHDAARGDFTKSLERVSASDWAVIDMAAVGANELGQIKDTDTSAIIASIRSLATDKLNGVDGAKYAKAIVGLAKGEKTAARDLIRASEHLRNPLTCLVEFKKSQFASLSIELNRKKLDLEEIEKQYRREDR